MNRRTFMKQFIATAIGAGAVAANFAWAKSREIERPNVLLIMTDQQTADAMSCAGNRYVETPALDRIAARGVRFERAYVTQPLCLPFRSGLQTGRYPTRSGRPTTAGNSTATIPCWEN